MPARPRRLAALVLVVVAAVWISGCGGGDGDPDASPAADAPGPDADLTNLPRIEPAACRYDVAAGLGLVEGVGYTCGDLVVAEDRAAPTRAIKLHFIRFASPAATGNATIYLDGGPGGDGQNIVSYTGFLGPSFLDGMLVDGDFLVLGQRGTSRSIPFLDCQLPDCADHAATADLAAYNTGANADDVDDLRAALGLERLNLYGISYGSRLGLEVIRRHGDRLRSAVIEGLVPPQLVWPAAVPASFYGALTALDQACTDAGACGTAFGDLVTELLAGVTSLDAEPVIVDFGGVDYPLDGITYAFLVFQMMYSKTSYEWLPLVISDLAERRVDRVNDFLAAWLDTLGTDRQISTGLYYSVVCGEQFDPPHPGAFEAANAGVPQPFLDIYGAMYSGLLQVCATWPTGDHQAELEQPVTSAVRTLVSSGRFDPITPPGFADVAAATLSDAVVVVHEHSGHGATLQTPCGNATLHAFLADPTAALDTSCAATITTPFIVPSSAAGRAVPRAAIRAEAALAPVPPALRRYMRR